MTPNQPSEEDEYKTWQSLPMNRRLSHLDGVVVRSQERYKKLEKWVSDYEERSLQLQTKGWILVARELLNLSGNEVAKRMDIPRTCFYRLEKKCATGTISLGQMHAVAEALDCEFHFFFCPKEKRSFSDLVWSAVLKEVKEHRWHLGYPAAFRRGELVKWAIGACERPEGRRELRWTERKSTSR